MRDRLVVGSLFSGIGGIELGLERTGGFRTAWHSEVDPYCAAILRRHWPDVPNLGDVRDIGPDAPRVDVLAGGFPCQPVSQAGRKRAQEDDRWLWPEFGRLVGALRPRLVLVENVPGLAVRGLADVVGTLAELGYDAEWGLVSAADVGAPHLRKRLYLVASDREAPADSRRLARPTAGERQERPGATGQHEAQGGAQGRPLAGAPGRAGRPYEPAVWDWGIYADAIRRWEQRLGRPAPTPMDAEGWMEPEFVEWLMGFPHEWTTGERRDRRLKALGNSVQVQASEHVGRLILNAVEEGRL